ncbi:MAG: hypothetical protein IPI90_15790 [Saprospiraceae bacterium]|nr:hypothetical protein [Candidatus Vicinibacter affinis]
MIDLVREEGVSAVPDIKIYNNVPINKTIRSITGGVQHVFINADYGISYLNLEQWLHCLYCFPPNLKINHTLKYKDACTAHLQKGWTNLI